MRAVFFHPGDPTRPRAGWRLILFFVVWALTMILLTIPVAITDYSTDGDLFSRDAANDDHLLFSLISMVGILIAAKITARYVDRRPIADYGLRFNRDWWRDYGFGLLLGAAQMAFIFAVLLGGHWIAVESVRFTSAIAISLVFSLALHFTVGFGEELFLRGAPLLMLEEGFRSRRVPQIVATAIATLITSVVFGLMHAGNPNASMISTIALMVAGASLAIPVLLTRQLAISMGAHTSWNFVQGAVLGFAVSGQDLATPIIDTEPTGPLYLTGGAFGPEAGVISIAAEVLFVVAVIVYVKRTRGAARILPPPARIVPASLPNIILPLCPSPPSIPPPVKPPPRSRRSAAQTLS